MGRSKKSKYQRYLSGRNKILKNIEDMSVDDALRMGKEYHEKMQNAPVGTWNVSMPFNVASDVNKMQKELISKMYGDPSKYQSMFAESAATQYMAMENGNGDDKHLIVRVRDQDNGSVMYAQLADGVKCVPGMLLVNGEHGLVPLEHKDEEGLLKHLPLAGIDKILRELDELNTIENNFGKLPLPS